MAFLRKNPTDERDQIAGVPSITPGPIGAARKDREYATRQLANARLIAAAPDLLEALKNLYALVQGECPSLLEDNHHDDIVASAIAKAEGRA